MNYEQIYYSIINRRLNNKFDGYTENHHIIPRSLGGNDNAANIVSLTAREHYICHLLLTRIYSNDVKSYHKMLKAYYMMCNAKNNLHNRDYKVNSRLYEFLKVEFSKSMSISQSGSNNSQYHRIWIYSNKLRKSRKVNKTIELDGDWKYGRVIDFSYLDRCCLRCNVNLNLKSNLSIRQYCKKCAVVNHVGNKKTTVENRERSVLKKKCMCDGVEYMSVSEAARIMGVSYQVVQSRIKSKFNDRYYYIS